MSDQDHQREKFGSRYAFYFAAVGSAVGFGNVWRFPALAYSYGGGAFFIPYVLALFLVGLPILFLEIALGQYYQRGDVSVFASFHKRMRGIGLSSIACGYIVLTYYSMLISWVLRTLFESGSDDAPWKIEDVNATEAAGYFEMEIVGMKTLDFSTLRPTRLIGVNVGYSVLTFSIIFLCSAFGLKVTGRITYVTMGLPILILFMFLIRGCTLDGAVDGIEAYIGKWDLSVLKGDAWSTAVSQIFFSLSVTFGVMTAYGSHMHRNEPAFANSCVIAIVNSTFSFIAGFAVFAAVGHQAFRDGVEVDSLKDLIGGFTLVFGTWPVVLGTLPGGIHWIRLLFFTLFLLGIDSAFSFVEAVVTCCRDTARFRDTPKWIITAFFCITGFLLSILYATDAGLIFLDVVDFYINFLLLIVGFFESFGLGWVYNIEEQISKFGAPAVFTYMFSSIGSVLFGCAFWFGLEKHAIWAGFVAAILFEVVGSAIAVKMFKSDENTLSDLAFGNMKEFKAKVEPVIGTVPTVWCFLIKHFVPHVILVLLVNLANSKNAAGEPNFGHYSGYLAAPFQVLGVLAFVFAVLLVLIGAVAPNIYSSLDTHEEVSVKETEDQVVDEKDLEENEA